MLEHAEIAALLPHGHPMVLVDRVIRFEIGGSLTALKAVSAGESCYAGLGKGLNQAAYAYPLSLLLESFGQAAALLWLMGQSAGDRRAGGMLLLGGARKCVFRGDAYPGDVLRHEVRLVHATMGTAFVDGETFVGETPIASITSIVAAQRPRGPIAGRQ